MEQYIYSTTPLILSFYGMNSIIALPKKVCWPLNILNFCYSLQLLYVRHAMFFFFLKSTRDAKMH